MANIKQVTVAGTTYNIEPYTNYLPLAGGTMTGNLKMTENSTSIITRSASPEWAAGIYSSSSGDEVLGILVKNPRTHIMLGNGDPTTRPGCTALTPTIDIKNGKVGINKRIGVDGSADVSAVDTLSVNGSIFASENIQTAGNIVWKNTYSLNEDAKTSGPSTANTGNSTAFNTGPEGTGNTGPASSSTTINTYAMTFTNGVLTITSGTTSVANGSHTHTGPSHTHSVGAHSHGLNSHTHTFGYNS